MTNTNVMWDPNVGNVANPAFSSVGVGGGGMIDSVSGISGKNDFIQRLSLPVTAVTNTDFIMSIPTGATIITIAVYTTTAYTGTTAALTIGSAAGGAQYVASTSIASIGVVQLTLVNAAAAALLSMPTPPNLFIRIAQGATPTAVGAAMLVIDYTQA